MVNSSTTDVSMPSPKMNQFFSAVTPVRYHDRDGHATGFYFTDDNGKYYLITNRHVVATDDGAPAADAIRVVTRPSVDTQDIEFHDIPLEKGGEPVWIEHPAGSHLDIAAVPLPFSLDSTSSLTLHSGLFPPKEGKMPMNQDVVLLGYPMLEKAPYVPFLRKGHVATPYGSAYKDLPCFATDADMHGGTSGSPVFALPSPMPREGELLGDDFYLIGIHSATILHQRAPQEGPLDLNITWYIELLTDMLDVS